MGSSLQASRRTLSRMCALCCALACACMLLFAGASPAFAASPQTGSTATGTSGGAVASAGALSAQNLDPQDADEPIASGEIGTCAWAIDANGKLTIAPMQGDSGSIDFYNPTSSDPDTISSTDGRPPWYPHAAEITAAEVESTVSITGETCKMFESCVNLTSVDVSGLELSGAQSLNEMFYSCKKLTSVDMSMLKAPSAKSAANMFAFCSKLETIKLPDFRNTKLECISTMFQGCASLTSIDLSGIDTSRVEYATMMFSGCTSLQKVFASDKWDLHTFVEGHPSNVINFESMFTKCNALVGANGTTFAEAQVKDYTYARIDTPEAPGYFWPAENGSGGESGNTGEGGSGDGNGGNPDGTPVSGDSGTPSGQGSTSGSASSASPVVTLSASTYAYNGKTRTPAVTVKRGGKTLKAGSDYTVAYAKGRKAIGSYNVTVTGKKPRPFRVVKSFQIIPKTPKVKSLKAQKNSNGSSGFIAKWKKVGNKTIGYQVRWSPTKTFVTNSSFEFKGSSPYAKKGKAALQVKERAWLGKKAFVQVRAFKVVKGKKYYSRWSKAKKVKLKK